MFGFLRRLRILSIDLVGISGLDVLGVVIKIFRLLVDVSLLSLSGLSLFIALILSELCLRFLLRRGIIGGISQR